MWIMARGRPALSCWLAALAGGIAGWSTPAHAQGAPPAAPEAWVHYAEGATAAIARWLDADDPAAVRLHAYLDQHGSADGSRATPLVVKIWLHADGTVARIDFTPFALAQANEDLRAVIVGRRLPGRLPRGMAQPIRLEIVPEPVEASDPAGPSEAPR